MTVSLRTWLTLILVLVNAIVLGALAAWISADEVQQEADLQQRRLELGRRAREQFSQRFEPDRAGDIGKMLDWPLWDEFEEALILDDKVLDLEGGVTPVGAFLNPKGSRLRDPAFPLQEIARGITEAVQSAEATLVAGGIALPLITPEPQRRIWGGVYLRLPELPEATPFSLRVLLAAGAATLLGAGLVYFLVGRAVLRPIEVLARGAHEFGAGNDPHLPTSARTAEMNELLASFNQMMGRIRGFQGELSREVEAATRRAGQAERRAARQERLAAMGTLAAGLAHEINSPLAGAMQGVETLRGEAQSERAKRYGELTADALERIRGLVRRLLHLAPARVEVGSCVIQEVFDDLPAFLESRLDHHRLVVNAPASELRVNGSPGDVFPVLLNLVQNSLDALDARPGGASGLVTVEALPAEEGGAWIRVTDDGPGAPEEMLPHLFEPFVTDKEVGKGTGLGLALAYATVRQLGGEIEARNLEAGGLEVRLRLPAPQDAT